MNRNLFEHAVARLKSQGRIIIPTGTYGCGDQRLAIADHLSSELDLILAAAKDDASLKRTAELITAVAGGSEVARTELLSARVETINTFLVSQLRFANAFFEIRTLLPNERPYFQYEGRQEINILTTAGTEGQYRVQRAVKPQEEVPLSMTMLESETYEYPIRDLYNGMVVQNALKNIDAAHDLAAQLDTLAFDLANKAPGSGGFFGSLTYNAGPGSVFTTHSKIHVPNLPSSNDITLNAGFFASYNIDSANVNTNTSKLRQEVFDAIHAYTNAFGGVLEGLVPTGDIFVSSREVMGISSGLTIGGAAGSEIAEDIKKNGFAIIRYLGRDWRIIPDVNLKGGVAYAPFQAKVGYIYFKPDLDVEDVQRHVRKGFEDRVWMKAYGMAVPRPNRAKALRIKFRN